MWGLIHGDRRGLICALAAGVAALAGCTFDGSGLSPTPGGPDARQPTTITDDVAHVPSAGEYAGSGELWLAADSIIDTDRLAVGGFPYPDEPGAPVAFDVWMQEPASEGAAELAVLHVRGFHIAEEATVRVQGTRPLVVIAGDSIRIDGVLDASANADQPGAGGHLPGDGPGFGGAGGRSGDQDSGGGGAGFGGSGGSGGATEKKDGAPGGSGGGSHGDDEITLLQGGSGGGNGGGGVGSDDCPSGRGGGGGGAVQLYAAGVITIGPGGVVHVGGGGGGGAMGRDPDGDGTRDCGGQIGGGGGGGSGGGIYLQAPRIVLESADGLRAVLAANGGGGGSGASGGFSGNSGEDGRPDDTRAAHGASVGDYSGDGGQGGAGNEPDGERGKKRENAGGGGGGVGRIVVATREPGMIEDSGAVISPASHPITYGAGTTAHRP